MDAPRLTVAIPTYNGATHVETAVRSVLLQTDADFDLIVSDDRSTDDTIDRVRRVAGDRARIEINADRLGLAGNWNRCVERCRTPFVAIFHQDDVMKTGHLVAHLDALATGVGLVASGSEVIDERGLTVPETRVEPGGCGPLDRAYPTGEFLCELAVSNPLRCSAVSLRVDAHRVAGGFNPALRYVVDWDHWINVGRSWPVAWIARTTVQVRWHPASETHTFKTGTADLDESRELVSRLYRTNPDLGRFAPAARSRLALAYLNRAYDAARSGHPRLCRLALRRALRLRPTVLAKILADSRLLGRLGLGALGLGTPPDP
jgi:glycosyltransferase involved in cell wall biosynthesis